MPPMWAWKRSTGSMLSRRTLGVEVEAAGGEARPYLRTRSMMFVVR
jgi:hypothetical protein